MSLGRSLLYDLFFLIDVHLSLRQHPRGLPNMLTRYLSPLSLTFSLLLTNFGSRLLPSRAVVRRLVASDKYSPSRRPNKALHFVPQTIQPRHKRREHLSQASPSFQSLDVAALTVVSSPATT